MDKLDKAFLSAAASVYPALVQQVHTGWGEIWPMTRRSIEWQPTRRDELITEARYGRITPDEAEAQAKNAGVKPLAWQPELPAFDPMLEGRWTIVMAIAWIASRDRMLVQYNSAGFAAETTF